MIRAEQDQVVLRHLLVIVVALVVVVAVVVVVVVVVATARTSGTAGLGAEERARPSPQTCLLASTVRSSRTRSRCSRGWSRTLATR